MTPDGMPNKNLTREALDYAHEVVSFCCERISQIKQQESPEPQERYYDPPEGGGGRSDDRDDR